MKIGDRIRILKNPSRYDDDPGWVKRMNTFVGRTAVVSDVLPTGVVILDISGLIVWDIRWLEQIGPRRVDRFESILEEMI